MNVDLFVCDPWNVLLMVSNAFDTFIRCKVMTRNLVQTFQPSYMHFRVLTLSKFNLAICHKSFKLSMLKMSPIKFVYVDANPAESKNGSGSINLVP